MDAGLAAFLGALAGAVGAGVPPVVAAAIQRGNDKAQRRHDADQADLDRQAAATEAINTARRQQVREWRDGLEAAHKEYQEWQLVTRGGRNSDAMEPPLVGMAWFQSLREHLSTEGAPNQRGKPNVYREVPTLPADDDAADVLSKEISRIAREWGLE